MPLCVALFDVFGGTRRRSLSEDGAVRSDGCVLFVSCLPRPSLPHSALKYIVSSKIDHKKYYQPVHKASELCMGIQGGPTSSLRHWVLNLGVVSSTVLSFQTMKRQMLQFLTSIMLWSGCEEKLEICDSWRVTQKQKPRY